MIDGVPLRKHLEAVAKGTGRRPQQLDGPACPVALGYLWEWFVALSLRRQSNGYGANRISAEAMAAWFALRGIRPTGFELDVLDDLEMLFFECAVGNDAPKSRR
jgi:hypothetical protein